MAHVFRDLKGFASKEHKFQQRKSIGPARAMHGDWLTDGLCVGLVMMWVQEKCTRMPSLLRWNKDFSPGIFEKNVHKSNSNTMLKAVKYQELYTRQRGQLDGVATDLGLRDATFDIQPVRQPGSSEIQILETLVRAGEDLPEGGAVVFQLGVRVGGRNAGHAVAMYQSRRRHLHFFDPNVGVYQVRDVSGFMQAWIDGCGERGWTLHAPPRGDWILCYT